MSQTFAELERSLAFEHATSVIKTYGVAAEPEGEDEVRDFFDMTKALHEEDCDSVKRCLTYLEQRSLLIRSAANPNILALKDEHEERRAPTAPADADRLSGAVTLGVGALPQDVRLYEGRALSGSEIVPMRPVYPKDIGQPEQWSAPPDQIRRRQSED